MEHRHLGNNNCKRKTVCFACERQRCKEISMTCYQFIHSVVRVFDPRITDPTHTTGLTRPTQPSIIVEGLPLTVPSAAALPQFPSKIPSPAMAEFRRVLRPRPGETSERRGSGPPPDPRAAAAALPAANQRRSSPLSPSSFGWSATSLLTTTTSSEPLNFPNYTASASPPGGVGSRHSCQ